MARLPFTRLDEATIAVALPRPVVKLVAAEVARVRSILHNPAAPGRSRLLAPINVSFDEDDVLALLDREMELEMLCTRVADSTRQATLSIEEAQSWLRLLTLACALHVAQCGVVDEDDLERVPLQVQTHLNLLQAVQVNLLDALDANDED